MKFEEALPLMRQGRKFLRRCWNATGGAWNVFDLNEDGLTAIKNIIADDWEEVRTPWREELKDGSFAEALVGMMRGEVWRRPKWPEGFTLDDGCHYGLFFADLTATDWERVS